MIAVIGHSRDPYDAVIDVIDYWCSKHYYTHAIVTLELDGNIVTDILLYDGSSHTFEWSNDWYEGQKDIKVLGFRMLDEFKIEGYPEEENN